MVADHVNAGRKLLRGHQRRRLLLFDRGCFSVALLLQPVAHFRIFQQIEKELNLRRRLGRFGRRRLRLSHRHGRPESGNGQRQQGEAKQIRACRNCKSHK